VDLAAALEKTRRDLLELTARNRLVHTPLEGKRKSWIPISDERSDQLFDILVRQGKVMSFLPAESDVRDDDHEQFLRLFDQEGDEAVPKADADGSEPELAAEFDDGPADTTELDNAHPDDAERADAEPDNAEPAEQHTDRFLQTPFAKEKLDDKLLRHFYDARTAEEEQQQWIGGHQVSVDGAAGRSPA
jgi:hypothetical protein